MKAFLVALRWSSTLPPSGISLARFSFSLQRLPVGVCWNGAQFSLLVIEPFDHLSDQDGRMQCRRYVRSVHQEGSISISGWCRCGQFDFPWCVTLDHGKVSNSCSESGYNHPLVNRFPLQERSVGVSAEQETNFSVAEFDPTPICVLQSLATDFAQLIRHASLASCANLPW